jgi:Lysozyme like domain
MAYAGSFAKGFIDAFLAAQNLQMRRRHYQMMQDYYDYKMRLNGYDRPSGKWINPQTGKPEFDSQAQYFKAMQQMFPTQSMFRDGDGPGSSDTKQIEPGEGGKGTYSLAQMTQMAEKAGFQGEDAAHMAALAQAESGGNPNAVGSAGEIGLTQINPHAWGADMANTAKDPQEAFNAAHKVFEKQGWGAWSTDPSSANFTPGNNGMRFFEAAKKAQAAASAMAAPTDKSTTGKGPTAKTASGKPVQTDDQGRALDPTTGKPTPPAPVKTSDTAIPSPTQLASAAPQPDEDIATGPPDPQWSAYNAPAVLKQPPPSAPPPQAVPAQGAAPAPAPQQAGPDTSAPPPDGNTSTPDTMMSAKGGAIPYNSYRFTKYDDGGYVGSDTAPVVTSDASVQGDTNQTQQGAQQMSAAAGSMGKSFSAAEGAKYDKALRKSFTPNSSSSKQVPSLWNLPQNIGNSIKSNLMNSPAGKFFQNPGASLQAIPGSIAQNFQQSPVGQALSGSTSGYRRGGRVIKLDDGGDAGGDAGFGASAADTAQGNAAGYGMGAGMGNPAGAPTGTTTAVGWGGGAGGTDAGAPGAPSSTSDAMGTSVSMGAVGEAAAAMGPGTGYGGFGGGGGGAGGGGGGSGSAAAATGGGGGTASGGSSTGPSKMTFRLSPGLAPPGGDSPTSVAPDPSIAARRGPSTFQSAYATLSPDQKANLALQLANIHGGQATVAPSQSQGLADLGPAQMAQLQIGLANLHGGMGNPALGFNTAAATASHFGDPTMGPSAPVGTATAETMGAPGVSTAGLSAPTGPTGVAAITALRGQQQQQEQQGSPGALSFAAPGTPGATVGVVGAPSGYGVPGTNAFGNAPLSAIQNFVGVEGVAHNEPYSPYTPGPAPQNISYGGHGSAGSGGGTGGRYRGGPIERPIRRYALGGPVTYFANGGGVDEQPVVQPNPIDYSASNVSAEQLSGGSPSSSSADDYEDSRDDAEMQKLDMEGPSEEGLPLGTPQISDQFGNPSQGATDGVIAGAQSLIADNSLVTTGAIPNQDESSNKNNFYNKNADMDSDHKFAVDKAVDPDNQLSPNMRHLASIESIYKYGVLTGHEKDGAAAAGAYLKSLVTKGQEFGAKAEEAMRKGNIDDAVGNLVAGYQHIPDGMHVNAKVNDDGTVHVQQVDLHNKVQWEGDVGKDEIMKAADGLKTGQAFWSVVGQSMAKYDPKDGAKVPLDPKQADYDTAVKQLVGIEQNINSKYFRGNDPIVNGRVAHMPDIPSPTGNAQFDRMQQTQYTNTRNQWQNYANENQKLAQRETNAAKVDYLQQYHKAAQAHSNTYGLQKQQMAEQHGMVKDQLDQISKAMDVKNKEFDDQEKAQRQAQIKQETPLPMLTQMRDSEGKETNSYNEVGKALKNTFAQPDPSATDQDKDQQTRFNKVFPTIENQHALTFGGNDIVRYNKIPPENAADIAKSFVTSKEFTKDNHRDTEGVAGDKRVLIALPGQNPFTMSPEGFRQLSNARKEYWDNQPKTKTQTQTQTAVPPPPLSQRFRPAVTPPATHLEQTIPGRPPRVVPNAAIPSQ